MSKAYHRTKLRFTVPEGCKGYNCRRCIFKGLRPCKLPTFMKIETTRIYEDYPRPIYKVSVTRTTHSTKYNCLNII